MKNFPFPKKTVNLTSRNALHWNTICSKNSCMEVAPIFNYLIFEPLQFYKYISSWILENSSTQTYVLIVAEAFFYFIQNQKVAFSLHFSSLSLFSLFLFRSTFFGLTVQKKLVFWLFSVTWLCSLAFNYILINWQKDSSWTGMKLHETKPQFFDHTEGEFPLSSNFTCLSGYHLRV